MRRWLDNFQVPKSDSIFFEGMRHYCSKKILIDRETHVENKKKKKKKKIKKNTYDYLPEMKIHLHTDATKYILHAL